MSQEIINIGAAPNDGTGDPLRTMAIKCNDNFTQLYARVQGNIPTNPVGAPGDEPGMYAVTPGGFYFCYGTYDGNSNIWGSCPVSANSLGNITSLVNGLTSVVLTPTSGNVISFINGSIVDTLTAQGHSVLGNVDASKWVIGQVISTGTGNLQLRGTTISESTGTITLDPYNDGVNSGTVNVLGDVSSTGTIYAAGLIVPGPVTMADLSLTGNLNVAQTMTATVSNVTSAFMDAATISTSLFVTGATNFNGPVDLAGGVTLSSPVTGAGSISTTGNVTAPYFIGNGALLTGMPIYADANVITLMASGTVPLVSAGILAGEGGNISNIQFTNIPGAPAAISAVVATGLANGAYTTINTTTLTAGSLGGDGGRLSNIIYANVVGAYTNANVTSLLPIYSGNVNAAFYSGDGGYLSNVQAANVIGGYSNANAASFLASNTAFNITTAGVITGDGTGLTNLLWSSIPGANLNVAAYLASGLIASNIVTLSSIVGAVVEANTVSAGSGNLTMSGTTLGATTNPMYLDPGLDSSPLTGDVVVLGNLSLTGNITYVDILTSYTSNLQWAAATSANTPAAATGGGLVVGNAVTPYASWLYNGGTNSWVSNININAPSASFTGAVTANSFVGDGGGFSNIQWSAIPGANANVAAYLTSGPATNIAISGIMSATHYFGEGGNISNIQWSQILNANTFVEAYLPTSNTIIAIQSNVGNANANLANVWSNIALINSNVANTNANVAAVNSNVANTDANVVTINANLTNVWSNITSTNSNVANLTANVGNAWTEIGNINSNVANTDANVANITANVGNLWTALANTDANVGAVTNSLASLSTTVLALSNDLANTDANVVAVNSNVANTDANVASLVTSLANTDANVGNITVALSNTDSNVANAFTAIAATDANVANTDANIVTINANLTNVWSNITATNSNLANTDVNVVNLWSNVIALVANTYANTNAAAYFSSGTVNSNIQTSAAVIGGNLSMAGNTISSANDITLDPLGDNNPLTGNVVVLGNLSVAGNVTYVDVSTAITSNLLWVAANDATSNVAATGGGLAVGPANAPYASWTYAAVLEQWQTSQGVKAAFGNFVGSVTGSNLAGEGGNVSNIKWDNIANANINMENYVSNSLTVANIFADIANINSNVANTDANIVTINADLSNVWANITLINSNVANTDANVVTVNNDLSNVWSNITAINSNVANTDANVANAFTAIAATDANVANLTSALANTDSNVVTLTANVGNAWTEIANVNANVANADANIANLLANSYANTNAAAYLASGNITTDIITTANANVGSLNVANGIVITGNTIAISNSEIVLDPLHDGSALTGDVVVLGNLSVTGNVTYNDVSTAVTSNLLWVAADDSNTALAASGGGLAVGPNAAPYATLTYDTAANAWRSNIGIIAPFLEGDGNSFSNIQWSNITGANSNVEAYLGISPIIANINSNVANTDANIVTINANLTNVWSNISSTDSNVANIVVELGNINSNVVNTDSNVANLVTALANTDANVANITTDISNITANLANTDSNVANIVVELGNINANVANTDSNVANIVVELGNINANVANTDSNVANIVVALAATDANVANAFTDIANLQANSYSNANVDAYLPVYVGNIAAGNISATGNIEGAYILGNGKFLTGLEYLDYANANVIALLESGNVANNIVTTAQFGGNLAIGNSEALLASNAAVWGGTVANATFTAGVYTDTLPGSQLFTFASQSGVFSVQMDGSMFIGDGLGATPHGLDTNSAGSLVVENGAYANWFTGDGGNISNIQFANVVGAYSNSNVADYLTVYAGDILADIVTANILVGEAGNISNVQAANIVGTVANANVVTDNAQPNITSVGTLTTLSVSGNIEIGSVTGNIIPDANITYSLGNATNQWKDLWLSNSTLYLDSIPLTSTGNDLLFNGNLIVTTDANTANTTISDLNSNTVSVAGNVTANVIVLGNNTVTMGIVDWVVSSSTSTGGIILYEVPEANATGVDFFVTATSGTDCQISKLLAVAHGGGVNYIEYGSLTLGNTLADFQVAQVGSNVRLIAIPASAATTDYRVTINTHQ